MKSFFMFLKSKEIRGHLITAAIGFVIVLIGSFVVKASNISFFVNLAGAVFMLTSVQQIMSKIPKE